MLADLHTHTHFSPDSNADIDEMCLAAIRQGLAVIAFTDHFDMWESPDQFGSTYDADAARAEILSAKARYSDRLCVLYGIELGEPVEFRAEATALLDNYDFDFIIGSLHNQPKKHDFYFSWGMENPPIEQMQAEFSDYLDALAEVAAFPKIHTLAHITYPLRYAAQCGKLFDITPYLAKFDRIFQILIRRNIALEVNTSGLRQSLGTTLPDTSLLARYYDMGGRLLTVGSDAHFPADVGAHVLETTTALTQKGFLCNTII